MNKLFAIIFYVLLLDSLIANIFVWFGIGGKWYSENFPRFSKVFPLSTGWVSFYLVWVLFLGLILCYFKVLPWPVS